ncbi:hsp70-like protein [Colletotrichum costaricense]|uniref:Hsp70-like protein n=1 Tax=Colletotrichum costaricense TaxID=1209916 RepID=A0AAI9Z4G7_9PEZI|nr:hsp70-like protein [Colletotrichum costaricense]KAK1534310.1 hsp70-like protein [Colletotrichum costaricense]
MSSFLIVSAAKNQVAMNPHNTVVFDAKRLIGRKLQDSRVHNDRTHSKLQHTCFPFIVHIMDPFLTYLKILRNGLQV